MINENEKFIIDDLAKAEWAMKKIAKRQGELVILQEQAERMKADIDKWLLRETTEKQDDISYLENLLKPFAESSIQGTKKKSLALPSGKIGFRAGAKNFVLNGTKVTNTMPELITFVKGSSPEFIETKESVKWADYKKTLNADGDKVITADGEIIEGMTIQQSEPKFYVDVKGVV